jgi:hypothetical protein
VIEDGACYSLTSPIRSGLKGAAVSMFLARIVASGGDGSAIAGGAVFERFFHELSHQ